MTCGIYMIQNLVNGKVYIGQAVDIERRWKHHKWELENNRHSNKHLQRAWNKVGEDRFEFTIICECDESQLNTMEMDYIAKLRAYNQDFGYNKTYGGSNGRPTEETRQKMSEASKGENNHFFGKHHSEETRKKLREANKGKIMPEETKKKISESNKGKIFSEEHRKKLSESQKGEKNHMYGKHLPEETRKKMSESQKIAQNRPEVKKKLREALKGHVVTEETRKKISEANKGKTMSEEAKKKIRENNHMKGKFGVKHHNSIPVAQLTLEGELANVYGALMEAERSGFNCKNISSCCRGKRKTHGGYKWMYLHDYNSTIDISSIKTINLFDKPYEVTPKRIKPQVPIVQLTLEGELENIYESAGEAGRNGFNDDKIRLCCRGKRKTHKGYKWMRLDEYESIISSSNIKTIDLFGKPYRGQGISTPIVQLTLKDEFINVYKSLAEAERNGFTRSAITRCIKGIAKQHKGYKWMYLSDYEAMKKEG